MSGSEITVLENSELFLQVDAAFGARVIELRNLRTGRNWMAPGGRDVDTAEGAAYGGLQTAGWDECFPTISPLQTQDPAWGRRLRDHGDLWGRPWQVQSDGKRIEATFSADRFSFSRIITLGHNVIDVAYAVKNLADQALPYLWSQHCVLAVEEQDRLDVAGINALSTTFYEHRGIPANVGQAAWPHGPGALGDLRTLPPKETRLAAKMYAAVAGRFAATVGQPDDYLRLEWSQQDAPFVGLWMNFGGWPSESPLYHIAIEPTSAPADHLAGARAMSRERVLDPGAIHTWNIRLSVGPVREK